MYQSAPVSPQEVIGTVTTGTGREEVSVARDSVVAADEAVAGEHRGGEGQAGQGEGE